MEVASWVSSGRSERNESSTSEPAALFTRCIILYTVYYGLPKLRDTWSPRSLFLNIFLIHFADADSTSMCFSPNGKPEAQHAGLGVEDFTSDQAGSFRAAIATIEEKQDFYSLQWYYEVLPSRLHASLAMLPIQRSRHTMISARIL